MPQATYPKTVRTTHCFPIWSCSKWGLPCHELLPVMRCALTTPFHPYLSYKKLGGLLSAALAVSSRFPDVIWHFVLWSPDFPRNVSPFRDYLTNFSRRLWVYLEQLQDILSKELALSLFLLQLGACPRIEIVVKRTF